MHEAKTSKTRKKPARAAAVCAASLALALCASPALAADQNVNGPTPQDATVTLSGTVKEKPAGTISVTMPTSIAFDVSLTPDGKYSTLVMPTNAAIVNNSTDAGVSAAVTTVTETHPAAATSLLDKMIIKLNNQALVVGSGLNLPIGQTGPAQGGGVPSKIDLNLVGEKLPANPVITSGSYTVSPVITLSRVPQP